MATIKYLIQGKKNPTPIYVRFRDGRSIDIKTKTELLISPSHWSNTKSKPKHLKDESLVEIDNKLSKLRDKINREYNSIQQGAVIDSHWLKKVVNPSKNSTIPLQLIRYVDYYVERKKSTTKQESLKKYRSNNEVLKRYENHSGKIIQLTFVDEALLDDLQSYCYDVEGYAQNTVARFIKFVKTICYHAERQGIKINPNIREVSVRFEKIKPVFLNESEIIKITSFPLQQDYLNNARDWFIISCETAQRVSDFMRFNEQMISGGDKVSFIEYKQEKTNKIHRIPITKTVQAILDKRGGSFPRAISDVNFNKYIKEVCQRAEINEIIAGRKRDTKTNRMVKGNYPKYELVTAHIGRRSFATNHYGKMPTPYIIGMTGHSSEKQLLSYIGKTDTQTSEEIAEYFKKVGKI